jgi:hypothetical protein
MSQDRPGSGVSMWQAIQRSLCVSRAALGTTYVLWSARSAADRSPDTPASGTAVAGILGTRHLAQALLTAERPTSATLMLGAGADAAHAASMVVLAVVSDRWRRYALGDALVAASLGAVGLACAATAPASNRGSWSFHVRLPLMRGGRLGCLYVRPNRGRRRLLPWPA